MNNKGYASNMTTYAVIFMLAILFLIAIRTYMTHQARWSTEGRSVKELLSQQARPWERGFGDTGSESEDMRMKLLVADSPDFMEHKRRRPVRENPRVEQSKTVLKETSAGRRAYSLLILKYIDIIPADDLDASGPGTGWDAAWANEDNAVYVSASVVEGSSPEFLAAIAAHALGHADFDYNRGYWKEYALLRHPEFSPGDFKLSRDSVAEEFNALKSAALVWGEARKGQRNPVFESWIALNEQGEAYMTALVRSQLPRGTPEH